MLSMACELMTSASAEFPELIPRCPSCLSAILVPSIEGHRPCRTCLRYRWQTFLQRLAIHKVRAKTGVDILEGRWR